MLNFNNLHFRESLAAFALFGSLGLCVSAQTPRERGSVDRIAGATVSANQDSPAPVARENELKCTGFIETQPPARRFEVIGSEQEQEQRIYAEGDYVYINGGAQTGVKVGDEFSVVRPRGKFKTSLSQKRGPLGIYTQELGRMRVVRVKQDVSVALVTETCDNILLGDLLRAAPQRPAPIVNAEETLDRFAEPTGKQRGRIVLARDGRELVSKDQVVFIDLGAEDSLKPGDRLTIYRPLGTGNITRFEDREVTPGGSGGFESERFRGGKFSIKAQRVRDTDDGHYRSTVTTPEIMSRRPSMPRKIVGEMVVISVETRTAAAVVTRVAQEIHTGDYVEVK